MNEIGVGGLSLEVATDNEAYLLNLMQRSLRESNCRGFHWRNISENRPQVKGVERAVGIMKEGLFTNWLALEAHLGMRLAGQVAKAFSSAYVPLYPAGLGVQLAYGVQCSPEKLCLQCGGARAVQLVQCNLCVRDVYSLQQLTVVGHVLPALGSYVSSCASSLALYALASHVHEKPLAGQSRPG